MKENSFIECSCHVLIDTFLLFFTRRLLTDRHLNKSHGFIRRSGKSELVLLETVHCFLVT